MTTRDELTRPCPSCALSFASTPHLPRVRCPCGIAYHCACIQDRRGCGPGCGASCLVAPPPDRTGSGGSPRADLVWTSLLLAPALPVALGLVALCAPGARGPSSVGPCDTSGLAALPLILLIAAVTLIPALLANVAGVALGLIAAGASSGPGRTAWALTAVAANVLPWVVALCLCG